MSLLRLLKLTGEPAHTKAGKSKSTNGAGSEITLTVSVSDPQRLAYKMAVNVPACDILNLAISPEAPDKVPSGAINFQVFMAPGVEKAVNTKVSYWHNDKPGASINAVISGG